MSATTIQFGQLPAILLRAPDGAEATITLYGAHLVSWKDIAGAGPAGTAGQERLFLSALSSLDGSRAIRGGVPVIFPQFAERGSGMRHGFARVSTWRLVDSGIVDSGEQDGAAFAVLALNQPDLAPQVAAAWPYPFELTLRVAVRARELGLALEVRNTGTEPFPFAAALHTYHLVEDVEAVRIDGLAGETLAITDKLDQVFEHVGPTLVFDNGADKLTLTQTGFTDAVVWNPGAADAAALSDMEDEEYRRFVCIEPAMLGPLTLAPGGAWRGEQRVNL